MIHILKEESFKANDPVINRLEDLIHDMKTPISIIYAIAQIIEDKNICFEKLPSLAEKIKDNCHFLLKIVESAMDERQLSSGGAAQNLIYGNIVSVIENIVDSMVPLADRKLIKFDMSSNVAEMFVFYNHSTIERILHNLISNALKFTFTNEAVEILFTDCGTSYAIEVRDNGLGMTEERIARVFERRGNLDLQNNGSGIGLPSTKVLVESMGGSISVWNRTDGRTGLCVKIALPQEL